MKIHNMMLLVVVARYALVTAALGAQWPMKQRDVGNTGRADYTVPASRMNGTFFDSLQWQKRTPDSPADGNLGSSTMVFFDGAGTNGADLVVGGYHWPKGVQGMDRHTGKFFWAGNPDGGESIGANSAAFSTNGQTVYVANDATPHPQMAFSAIVGPAVYWHNGGDTNPVLLGAWSPKVAPDGRVFTHGWCDEAIGAFTDDGSVLSRTWWAVGSFESCRNSPALLVETNRLLVISGGRAGLIKAFDGNTGAEVWSINAGYHTDADATIDPVSGNIYLPVGESSIHVVGLNRDGQQLWDSIAKPVFIWQDGQNNPQRVEGPGCLSHDGFTYYFQSVSEQGDGRLYAINTTNGSVKWSFNTQSGGWEDFWSSPIVTLNSVIVVGNNLGGTYYALRDTGGSAVLLDTLPTSGGRASSSATLAPDGLLYLPARLPWTQTNGDPEIPTQQIENLFNAFDLHTPGGASPTNDNFSDATSIIGYSNYFAGSTLNATVENGESFFPPSPSVWWLLQATSNGLVHVENRGEYLPYLQAFQGTALSNLTPVFSSLGAACSFTFNVQAGGSYYLRATTGFVVTNFAFAFSFSAAPSNDLFFSRAVIAPELRRANGTTLAATFEAGEPPHGSNSVWWTWTPSENRSFFLTTAGSSFDTILTVFTGPAVTNLSQIASNASAYVWGTTNTGPRSDPASRVRLEAAAGTSYEIAVAGGLGDVMLTFEDLGIESITSLVRSVQLDESVNFTADLLLSNLRDADTDPLRIRLIAQRWFDPSTFPCPFPEVQDVSLPLGIFDLPPPGGIASSNSAVLGVGGIVPPPDAASRPRYSHAVIAILEELSGGIWVPHDRRMIVLGEWFNTAFTGGGVLNLLPTQSAGTGVGYLQVKIVPSAARQAGAGWKLQGEMTYRTNPNSTALISSNTPIVIEFAPVSGWNLPDSRTNQITLELLTTINATYTPVPPVVSLSPTSGLMLSGTTGTTYRVEYRTNLLSGTWLPLQTNMLNAGLNPILPWPPTNNLPAAFYRAVWLP